METFITHPIKSIRFRLKRKFTKMLPYMEKLMKKHSLVGDHTFFDNTQFAWISELEANWHQIRKELDEVLSNTHIPSFQEVSTQQKELTQDDKWKTFVFYFYGHQRDENCNRCPDTIKLLNQIPGMKTAFFSILAPNKHIPAHRGPYNGVLRLHLGLRVPENKMNCKIRVGNDFGYWEEGKGLVFDDSYEHEVWNNTDEIRVVLFIDFLRPLPWPYSLFNRLYIKYIAASDFIQDALGNLNNIAKNKKSTKTISKAPVS